MPPIILHMAVAEEAAGALGHPILRDCRGDFLLGATVPDIRIITGSTREATHYYDLACYDAQDGVNRFFREHPALSKTGPARSPSVRAFVSGCLSHLVMDEVWITQIYRPFFGKGSALAEDPMANMLDRALQFEMDRRERLNTARMDLLRSHLQNVNPGAGDGLFASGTLLEWRDFVVTASKREPSWATFRGYADRFLVPQRKVDHAQVEAFLSSLPTSLDRVLAIVRPERLEAFREESLEDSVVTLREYLS